MYASTLNPPHKGGHRGIVAMLATTERNRSSVCDDERFIFTYIFNG